MSGRIPSNLLRIHSRIGVLLAGLSPEDAAIVLIDYVELLGLRGTEMWARFMDRHRKRTGIRPDPDRNFSGQIPVSIHPVSGVAPVDTGDLPAAGGKGGSLSPMISADLVLDPSAGSPRHKQIRGEVTDTARAIDVPAVDDVSPPPKLALVPPPAALSSRAPRVSRRAGTRTQMPGGFGVSIAIEEMCRQEDLPDPHVVLHQFRDDCIAKGRTYVDWEAAFRVWMRSPITADKYPPWSRSAESEREILIARQATVTTPGRPLFTREQLGLAETETPSVEIDNDGFDDRIDEAFGAAQEAWK